MMGDREANGADFGMTKLGEISPFTVFANLAALLDGEKSKMELKLKPETITAAVIVIGFFLPWSQLLGFGVSGYNIGQLGSYGNWAWLILVSSIITVVLFSVDIGEHNEGLAKLSAYATGILPIAGMLYGLRIFGPKLFQLLSIGAYICIVAGMILIVMRLQKDFN